MRQKLTSILLPISIFQRRHASQFLCQRAQNLEHASMLLRAKQRKFDCNFARFMPKLTPQWILANTANEYKTILGKEKGTQCQAYIDERVRLLTLAHKTVEEMAEENSIIKAYPCTVAKLIVGLAGVGECDEQANYCFALSHARGRSDIAKVRVNLGAGSTGQKYPHLFLLIGEINCETLFSLLLSQGRTLKNLGKLPAHITLLDPLLGCVHPVNDWINSPLNNYINVHQKALNFKAIIEGVGIDQHADQDVYLELISIAEEIFEQHFTDKPDFPLSPALGTRTK